MPTRRLAARASNSEDSHRSQSEAAADGPGPDLDEEAGGPGCCKRAMPATGCHLMLLCKKDSEGQLLGLSEERSRHLCLQTSVSGLRHAQITPD